MKFGRPYPARRHSSAGTLVQTVLGGVRYANPETLTLLAAMSVEPNAARKLLIDNFITALKSAGYWAKRASIFVFEAHDVQAALLDWKDPSKSATRIASCTFTADVGFTGNSSTMGIQHHTNLNAVAGFTSTDAGYDVYYTNNLQTSAFDTRTPSSVNSIFQPRNASDQCWVRVTASGYNNTNGETTSIGMWSANRTASDHVNVFHDNTQPGNFLQFSVAVPAEAFNFLHTTSPHTIGLSGIGGSITLAEAQALKAAHDTYLAGL